MAPSPHPLEALLDRLEREPGLCVFDLDSTLLDNRPRSARIFREFGIEAALPALGTIEPDHFVDWNLERAMQSCGLDAQTIARHGAALRDFWAARFFTSAYCVEDVAIPGAPSFVHALARLCTVCYLTGRDESMRAGTLACFAREGFPLPDQAAIHLLMKPTAETLDDEFKRQAHTELPGLGTLVAAFDNEPTHVNDYAVSFPDARVVHLATDHSGRPVEVRQEIPSILDFRDGS